MDNLGTIELQDNSEFWERQQARHENYRKAHPEKCKCQVLSGPLEINPKWSKCYGGVPIWEREGDKFR